MITNSFVMADVSRINESNPTARRRHLSHESKTVTAEQEKKKDSGKGIHTPLRHMDVHSAGELAVLPALGG